MAGQDILINWAPQETRVAVVENGAVQELHVERTLERGLVGNVYLGKVVRVLPGMQSAFVDIGLERAAFLHVADLHPHAGGWNNGGGRGDPVLPIERQVFEGQTLTVQVIKDAIGTKGARLSTQISIAGRMLVYLPQDNHIGISQKIGSPELREQLRARMVALTAEAEARNGSDGKAPERGGFILRTNAEEATDAELAEDIAYLRRAWALIRQRAQTQPPGTLLHQDLSLAERVLRPLATPGAPGAWYRGFRVMALDGSCLDVADEAANAEFFGYPAASRGQSAFPQARVLGLVECGTHAVVGASIAPYSHSEQALAAQLLPARLKPEMLVLADRNFYGFKLWQTACATGARLAWRVRSTLKLPVQQVLADGSYLSAVFDSADRARSAGQTVRVIDYTLEGSATQPQDSYRLVTNILDPDAAPALELAGLYHERWEIEGVFDEFKTHLRANSTVLRSKTPELVLQELWGLLLAHFAIRQLMAQAAWPRGLDPDRLSFTHAVRVIKRKMPQAAAVPP